MLGGKVFDFPKPVPFIEDLISLGTNKDSIILDFFGGSGTTAEAVFRKNIVDGGNRKFILVQLPERTPNNSNAKKLGYDTIPELARDRINKAGKQIFKEHPSEIEKLDIGFKVFELEKSNLKKWNTEPEDLRIMLDSIQDNLEYGSTEDDLVYEIMLKQGLELTLPIEKIIVDGANIYKVAYGSLFIVLGKNITSTVARKIVELITNEELESVAVVLQDTGFTNDSEKLNSIEILNAGGVEYKDILSI